MKFYAFDLMLWTPFNVKGKFFEDRKDSAILGAKTTTSQFMYPMWLRAPMRADPRRTAKPTDADLMVMTDSFVDVSPFTAKFVYHTLNPEKDAASWAKLGQWWDAEVQGEQSGRLVVAEARRRLATLKALVDTDNTAADPSVSRGKPAGTKTKWAYLLPSEWMFSHDALSPDLKLSSALADVAEDSMTAVTDFDDGGPSLAAIVTTVPFTVHSAIAARLLASGGAVDYGAKKMQTFFKGTGDRGVEGALKQLVSVRQSLRQLSGSKKHGHAVFVSSDGMSKEEVRRLEGVEYAAGMAESTYCWVPRGDNPTSRRMFDALAAGCIPVVVSDDIARYLPFRWAIEWRSMILQVPEAVFNSDPEGVADAVLALPHKVVASLRARMDGARTSILWNDRPEPREACATEGRDSEACSKAPQLYLDEMLYRVKTGNFAVDQPLCKPRASDPRFNHGAVWNAEKSCPPWLKMSKLC
jgi:hypothetical protein